eukprot:755562-Hanusia_phi.AAC.7
MAVSSAASTAAQPQQHRDSLAARSLHCQAGPGWPLVRLSEVGQGLYEGLTIHCGLARRGGRAAAAGAVAVTRIGLSAAAA